MLLKELNHFSENNYVYLAGDFNSRPSKDLDYIIAEENNYDGILIEIHHNKWLHTIIYKYEVLTILIVIELRTIG